ncbi:hypothetical protein [Plantactinospora soyae]|uniref:ParB/Sulfiredoxin domain-containing protein n=1 Tax=Plantactinospora soyae TaxID=1544732 RepID=A0A927RAC3_9ACTN|nr:hypothetical protein [Plantactinospora soyae]MBE1490621.1 hypothetical protein [Plantactinospora soyae]
MATDTIPGTDPPNESDESTKRPDEPTAQGDEQFGVGTSRAEARQAVAEQDREDGEERTPDGTGQAGDDTAQSGGEGGVQDDDAPLTMLHPYGTLDKSSVDYWNDQSTNDIVASLRPGAQEPLTAKPDGTVMDGNTRIAVLESRGYDVNSLPRVTYEDKVMAEEDWWELGR